MADIFELDPVDITPGFKLDGGHGAWDSLALVSTIALVDDCFDVQLDGTALAACVTLADIEQLIAQATAA
jgi:acyl carrier protein